MKINNKFFRFAQDLEKLYYLLLVILKLKFCQSQPLLTTHKRSSTKQLLEISREIVRSQIR